MQFLSAFRGNIMDLPKRKPTRLKGYDYSQSGAYFITICTQNREQFFEMENVGNDLCVVPPEQNRIIHKWLKETENKFDNIKIDKYVICLTIFILSL